MKTATATPAYGRDYKSEAAVLKDWNEGKDFKLFSLPGGFDSYGSINELPFLKEKGIDAIQFRFKKNTETFIHKI